MSSGAGISLTAASHAVFFQTTFLATETFQAEGRLMRRGQRRHVLIQYVHLDTHVEHNIWRIVMGKAKHLSVSLDTAKYKDFKYETVRMKLENEPCVLKQAKI
jgi:hypothetical protein